MQNNFASDSVDMDIMPLRPEFELWDRTTIWSNFPEMSFNEMMESDNGLRQWLEMFYKVSFTYHNQEYLIKCFVCAFRTADKLGMGFINFTKFT